MTTIDPHRLAAALQRQLTSVRERGRTPATRSAAAPSRAVPARLSSEMLRQLARIASTDPDPRRKAVRLYLEGELAREFGAAVRNDPAFPQMVDAVQRRMQEDGEVAGAMRALGEWLLAGEGRG